MVERVGVGGSGGGLRVKGCSCSVSLCRAICWDKVTAKHREHQEEGAQVAGPRLHSTALTNTVFKQAGNSISARQMLA